MSMERNILISLLENIHDGRVSGRRYRSRMRGDSGNGDAGRIQALRPGKRRQMENEGVCTE